eukprot:6182831-Pleurochrysis_carterae.AAC.6
MYFSSLLLNYGLLIDEELQWSSVQPGCNPQLCQLDIFRHVFGSNCGMRWRDGPVLAARPGVSTQRPPSTAAFALMGKKVFTSYDEERSMSSYCYQCCHVVPGLIFRTSVRHPCAEPLCGIRALSCAYSPTPARKQPSRSQTIETTACELRVRSSVWKRMIEDEALWKGAAAGVPKVLAMQNGNCGAPWVSGHNGGRPPKFTFLVDERRHVIGRGHDVLGGSSPDVVLPYLISKPDWLVGVGKAPYPDVPWGKRKLLFFAGTPWAGLSSCQIVGVKAGVSFLPCMRAQMPGCTGGCILKIRSEAYLKRIEPCGDRREMAAGPHTGGCIKQWAKAKRRRH